MSTFEAAVLFDSRCFSSSSLAIKKFKLGSCGTKHDDSEFYRKTTTQNNINNNNNNIIK